MIQKIIEYKNLLNELGTLIENSPYKKGYIIEKVGISAPTFYRKLKSQTFTPDETLEIARLLTPEEAYLYDLKESIKRGKADYRNGDVHLRNEVVEEIKNLLIS